jgi:hypothetical protein
MKNFYKLFNSGTSEGVKKAWMTRQRRKQFDPNTIKIGGLYRTRHHIDEDFPKGTKVVVQSVKKHSSYPSGYKVLALRAGRPAYGIHKELLTDADEGIEHENPLR